MSDDQPKQLSMEISCSDVHQMREGGEQFVLLDCREPDEHEVVHIEGSMLLPMSELMARAGELEEYRSQRLVVYCHVGGRSMQVAAWLRQRGFPEAQSMAGGIDAWAIQIDPYLARY
ncbi:MAG: rhodanese-like domain-containing protein [Pirellulales bacterium]